MAGSPVERRSSPRSRTLLGAVAREANKRVMWDCEVRNLSEHGARLETANPVWFPQSFELDVPVRQMRLQASIIWRTGRQLGVAFTGGEASPSAIERGELQRLTQEHGRL
ncbi:MAG: PilZ domain-containing protein [Hyphomicrobiales bacterium]|jgi:hypothetical protein|nr:PilZ domain-containing protein [Hyphomicrobiales bacterium]